MLNFVFFFFFFNDTATTEIYTTTDTLSLHDALPIPPATSAPPRRMARTPATDGTRASVPTFGGGSAPYREPSVNAMATMPIPVMTSATPPTITATVAAAAASPRCSGARECAPRGRAPAAEAARIGRRLVIGDGLYAAS